MEKKRGRGMIFTIVYDKHDTDTCLWLIDSLKISISTGKRIMISQYMYSTSHFSAIFHFVFTQLVRRSYHPHTDKKYSNSVISSPW